MTSVAIPQEQQVSAYQSSLRVHTRYSSVRETTFIVTHNYIGSDVDIDIEVFDMSGRLLWHRSETGVASGNAITANWDLTVESGARLKTGVYLYRVRLSSNGATKVSKAKKLIILDNK